jgi:hypothetical protein
MRGDVGVGLTSKAFKMIQVKDLVELLYKKTIEEQQLCNQMESPERDSKIQYIELGKSAAIEIMQIFANSPHVVDELSESSKVNR